MTKGWLSRTVCDGDLRKLVVAGKENVSGKGLCRKKRMMDDHDG
jgi:hypothetical protein